MAEISITNCSGAIVAWTAKSVAGRAGLGRWLPAAGHSAVVTATIDDDQVGPGAVDVKVKVSGAHNHYVELHAHDPLVGSDVVAGGGNLSPGDGPWAAPCSA